MSPGAPGEGQRGESRVWAAGKLRACRKVFTACGCAETNEKKEARKLGEDPRLSEGGVQATSWWALPRMACPGAQKRGHSLHAPYSLCEAGTASGPGRWGRSAIWRGCWVGTARRGTQKLAGGCAALCSFLGRDPHPP